MPIDYAPNFVVFVDNPPTLAQNDIIAALVKEGFDPLVDAIHGKDYTWMNKNFTECQYRFTHIYSAGYDFDDLELELTEEAEAQFPPSFVVYFHPEAEKISDLGWHCISEYLESIIIGYDVENRDEQQAIEHGRDMMGKHPKFVPTPESSQPPAEEVVRVENPYYEFNSHLIESRDVMFCEIMSGGNIPWTVIIRNYSVRGYKPLFTSLFACNSWSSAYNLQHTRAINFLHKLWGYLGMLGNMDLDTMLKEATEACYPREGGGVPTVQPEVYRRTLEQVMENFDNRQCITHIPVNTLRSIKRKRSSARLLVKRKLKSPKEEEE